MAFLVYFFVLLVAAASVVFGLDWTQAPLTPPPYATLPAQTATVTPAPSPVPAKSALSHSVAIAKTSTGNTETTARRTDSASVTSDAAEQAQASATPADTASITPAAAPAAPASCNVNACSAAYRSFRASDCTYQPSNGDRRLCTKSAAGKVAAAAHPRTARRLDPRDDYRYSDRRDSYYDRRDAYDDRRGGWSLFGGNDY